MEDYRLNIEHRTLNIEPRMGVDGNQIYDLGDRFFIRGWTFDVRCSMFIF
jgi:hypothetical protein